MLKKFLPLLLIASLFLCASVPAQNTAASLQVNNMEIDIWPDYDRPSTLVIYRISFASLTSFPAKVSFKIPTSAGNPHRVVMKDLDGLLYDLEYSVIPNGGWNQVEFITSSPDIQLEFYDPIREQSNGVHTYSFQWISDYPINDLKIVIQQPRSAPQIKLFPDLGSGAINHDDGLMYYTSDVGSVAINTTVNLALSYQPTSDQLSASTLPVRAVNPLSKNTNPFENLALLLNAIWENKSLFVAGSLIFIGLLLLALVLLLSLRKRTPTLASEVETKEPSQKKRTVSTFEVLEVYCHVCGKRAHPGDLYCRACGSKLILR